MNLHRFLVAPFFIVAAVGPVHGASTPPPTPRLGVSVTEITETRTTGSAPAQCVLTLTFTGDAVFDATAVRSIRVDRALDDLGRDLTPRKSWDRDFGRDPSSFGSSSLRSRLTLRTPSRAASAIQLVEGEVSLFAPTEANGGLVVIPDFLAHPGQLIENAQLKQNEIELMYITKEVLDAQKKQDAQNDPVSKMMAGMAEGFGGIFSRGMSNASKASIGLLIKDPGNRIVSIELQDATGQPLRTQGTFTSPSTRQINLAATPPADTRLVVNVASDAALRVYPLKLENIALP